MPRESREFKPFKSPAAFADELSTKIEQQKGQERFEAGLLIGQQVRSEETHGRIHQPNIYKPDSRLGQGAARSASESISRFRPKYRQLDPDEIALHDAIKMQAEILERLIHKVRNNKSTRYKALAITSLEESVMWAVKDLTGPK